jgi:hypothetical protein
MASEKAIGVARLAYGEALYEYGSGRHDKALVAALDAAAAVDGDAQWNAAIEATLEKLNGDMDSEMRAYAQHFAADIRSLKRLT